ncbi:MAG: Bacteroidetes-specific putative rane protein [Bacteroidetes bacterium]|jgi:type IX secretion system PorP/SprF family membrane protein|nr:Bacteroidetes-specific putative rane protein [Bacteroidota bacterium]
MKKLFAKIAITVAGITGVAVAQQDPQFTQWMHNKIIYNPGYAGTSGAICGNLQFRQQWANFDGAPVTIAVGADMRIPETPIGLGLTIINDKIGPMSTNFVRFAGAFDQKIGKGTLGLGLDVGILQKSISANWIVPEPGKIDNRIPGAYPDGTNPDLNKVTYDLGFGAFYQIPGTFYVGLSSSHLPAQTVAAGGDIKYKMTRHYYAMVGYTFKPGGGWHEFTPQIKYKSDLAAGALDANLTYAYVIKNQQKILAGATYRMNDAAALLLGYQMPFGKGMVGKIGYSYDFVLSKIKGYSSGTHEIVLGVCYTPEVRKPTSYGDDRFLN